MIEMLEEAVRGESAIELSSPVFDDGERMPDWVGYVNENESPPLRIAGVPGSAGSLLLSVIHLEAAEVVDHPWIHRLAWDLDPETTTLERGWTPESATDGVNDYLEYGWGGPSPPEGEETYRFRVYALEQPLDLPAYTRRARVASTIGLENEILDATELTGTYAADQGTVFATEGPAGLRP